MTHTIALVDDDRNILTSVSMTLEQEGFHVRTYTDPYPATVSAQLNQLGLGATVPDDARFPDDVSSRGVRLTGWARLLWDWRGRGDYVYAVMCAR